MTDLRTAAQQALEALEAIREADTAGATPKMVVEARKMYEPTITALRAALAEPVYEPVQVCWLSKLQPDAYLPNGELNPKYLQPAPAEPVQEPVGIVTSMVKGGVTWHRWPSDIPDGTPLYAAPPQRKPLTDDELLETLQQIDPDTKRLLWPFLAFARAIERAHGIGGNA